ncbi:MAG: FtsW/RodA/SpoVE family cell cycle protein [Clostridia bacterium]|nr:FtsW/RodA/SpoVE family cell cycle protein [Clostridia bacterium]
MREFSVSIKDKYKLIDKCTVICVIGMTVLSLLTILGGYLAGGYSNFTFTRFFTQTFSGVVGFGIMIFLALIDYDMVIDRTAKGIFVFIIGFLLILVLFGRGEMGNKNWIYIPGMPFNVQPSEFCKPLFIVTFSKHIHSLKRSINHPLSILQLAAHAGIVIGLLALTKDLGTILVYICICAFMLFTAGLSVWYFIGGALVIAAVFPVIWSHLDTYQQQRILCGFNPELDPQHYGYQALRSKAAIASGGFFGTGLAGGYAYKSLPAAQSDFLFAVLAEKFGLLGCIAYMGFMGTLVVRILYIARKARKDYAATICTGIAAMFIVQTIENIGMCLAFLPVVGITLPFFSYGGSSVLSSFISVGLVLSIYTHKKKYYFEREEA